MSKQRLTIVILALLGIISCFLPWISQIISMLGFKVLTGQICLGLFSMILIISLIGDIKKDLRHWQLLVPYTLGILSLITSVLHIAVLLVVDSKSAMINDLSSSAQVGFAPYITASASLLVCVLLFVMKDSKTELENMTIVRRVVREEKPSRKKKKKVSTIAEETPEERKKKLLTGSRETPSDPTPSTENTTKSNEEPESKKDSNSSDHNRFMPK